MKATRLLWLAALMLLPLAHTLATDYTFNASDWAYTGDDADSLGLLAINCGDNNHIRDIRFERIRAEGLRRCRPFDLRIFQSEKYNRAPGCCIDSIVFVDFTIAPDVPDSCILPSRVEGMKDHPVGRYTLERVSHTTVTTANL